MPPTASLPTDRVPPRHELLARAVALADEVLLPRATAVDRGDADVREGLDTLAAAGLFGLHAPHPATPDPATAHAVTEALAGGCLTTTFVWVQHQGVVQRLAGAGGSLADDLLPELADGALRAGVGVGGIRPGRDPLVATRTDDGWRLDGVVPWVTGWGLVDVVLVAARETADGPVVWLLLDAPPVLDPGTALRSNADTVELHRVGTVACDHANSAVVRLLGHPVPGDRLVARQPYGEWADADAAGLRTNGSLPLGVAARCARLSGDDRLLTVVDEHRARLDQASEAQLPAARAAAASLAWHAAQRLVVEVGGSALATSAHAQRLAREALFLQVFGTRPSIRAAQLEALSRPPLADR